MFINNISSVENDNEDIILMSAQIVLIDILNIYCKPTSEGGYKELMHLYITDYLEKNMNITYKKFNIYNILKKQIL
jgi:hypothetical protein